MLLALLLISIQKISYLVICKAL